MTRAVPRAGETQGRWAIHPDDAAARWPSILAYALADTGLAARAQRIGHRYRNQAHHWPEARLDELVQMRQSAAAAPGAGRGGASPGGT